MRRLFWPLILGLVGCGILVALGIWQLQRLAWKEEMLAQIDAAILAPPVPVPLDPTAEGDRYLPVTAVGRFTDKEILVLSARQGEGPGYRVITAFVTADGRRILVDRGFLPEMERGIPRPGVEATITGNLQWPRDSDSYTTPPDAKTGIWFARDVPAMAAQLETEPLLVVLRTTTEMTPAAEPVPVGAEGIPNNHLQYAVTWFLLAVVWAGMTGYLLWRITRENHQKPAQRKPAR